MVFYRTDNMPGVGWVSRRADGIRRRYQMQKSLEQRLSRQRSR